MELRQLELININRTYTNGAFLCHSAENVVQCILNTHQSILLELLELHPFE
jgi:hypothetical protein